MPSGELVQCAKFYMKLDKGGGEMKVKTYHDMTVIEFGFGEHALCMATIEAIANLIEDCDSESAHVLRQTVDELEQLDSLTGHA
jgi:hypothetical protein